MYVYIEEILGVNFAIDFLIVATVVRLEKKPLKMAIFPALIGAGYSLAVIILPVISGFLFKAAVTVLMAVLISYPLDIKHIAIEALLITFAGIFAAGATLLLSAGNIDGLTYGISFDYPSLAAGCILGLSSFYFLSSFGKKYFLRSRSYLYCIMRFNDKRIRLKLLVDTGNLATLADGEKICFVKNDIFRKLFDIELLEFFDESDFVNWKNEASIFNEVTVAKIEHSNAVLFLPSVKAEILQEENEKKNLVWVSPLNISDNAFDGLCPAELFM